MTVISTVQVLEDVSEEHARKTITVEKFPHMPQIAAASIHPCKHAVTMKKAVQYDGDRQPPDHSGQVRLQSETSPQYWGL